VGVLAALQHTGGVWFGWSGKVAGDEPGPAQPGQRAA